MLMKRRFLLQLWPIFVLLMIVGLVVTACDSTETDTTIPQGIHTQLLVKAPEASLPLNEPVEVKSRTQDIQNCVSHVELYAVELPSGQTNVLIRSDRAPFEQTTFTTSQAFVPTQRGHYVIKVVGYNKLGDKMESDYIGFDVE